MEKLDDREMVSQRGTGAYLAPEISLELQYTRQSDAFGFGMLLNELLTGAVQYLKNSYCCLVSSVFIYCFDHDDHADIALVLVRQEAVSRL